MSHSTTLTLPETFFQSLTRVAQAEQKPVEQVMATALLVSLPPLDDLPTHLVENLSVLETLDEAALRKVMLEVVPAAKAEAIHELLERRQTEALTEAEQTELDQLQEEADLVMLRKGRAAVLLRFRGKVVPNLAELQRLQGAVA
jgi:hypothetical protein